MRRPAPNFRREVLTPLEQAGERALRSKKRVKRDEGARTRAREDFDAAKAALGVRFDAYAACIEHLARKHLRSTRSRALAVREAPTVASVFGKPAPATDSGVRS
jgi:hypothetical protein